MDPAPKDFVTESFKNFCQFAADCPTVEVVVRPVLKVRPRDGRWIFWFERFIYFKACPWLSTFQISFHFNKHLVICKKIFAAKRAPWSHGCGGSCSCGSTAWSQWQRVAPTCMLCCLLHGSSYWRIRCRGDVKGILDNLVTMLYLSCIHWI